VFLGEGGGEELGGEGSHEKGGGLKEGEEEEVFHGRHHLKFGSSRVCKGKMEPVPKKEVTREKKK